MFLFASTAADLRRGQSVLITSTAGDSYTVRKGLLGRISVNANNAQSQAKLEEHLRALDELEEEDGDDVFD